MGNDLVTQTRRQEVLSPLKAIDLEEAIPRFRTAWNKQIDVIADVPDLNKTDVTLSVSPEGNQKSVAITTYIKNHIGEKVAIQYTGSGTKEDPYIIDDLSNAANPTIESK